MSESVDKRNNPDHDGRFRRNLQRPRLHYANELKVLKTELSNFRSRGATGGAKAVRKNRYFGLSDSRPDRGFKPSRRMARILGLGLAPATDRFPLASAELERSFLIFRSGRGYTFSLST